MECGEACFIVRLGYFVAAVRNANDGCFATAERDIADIATSLRVGSNGYVASNCGFNFNLARMVFTVGCHSRWPDRR